MMDSRAIVSNAVLVIVIFARLGLTAFYPEGACTSPNLPSPHATWCNWFYLCDNGQVRGTQMCPSKTVFNPTLHVCDWQKNVDCGRKGISNVETYNKPLPPPISQPTFTCPRPNGQFPDYKDCSAFYVCRQGRFTWNQCPRGQLYDKLNSKCNLASYVNCGANPNPGNQNPIRLPGQYLNPGQFGGGYIIDPNL